MPSNWLHLPTAKCIEGACAIVRNVGVRNANMGGVLRDCTLNFDEPLLLRPAAALPEALRPAKFDAAADWVIVYYGARIMSSARALFLLRTRTGTEPLPPLPAAVAPTVQVKEEATPAPPPMGDAMDLDPPPVSPHSLVNGKRKKEADAEEAPPSKRQKISVVEAAGPIPLTAVPYLSDQWLEVGTACPPPVTIGGPGLASTGHMASLVLVRTPGLAALVRAVLFLEKTGYIDQLLIWHRHRPTPLVSPGHSDMMRRLYTVATTEFAPSAVLDPRRRIRGCLESGDPGEFLHFEAAIYTLHLWAMRHTDPQTPSDDPRVTAAVYGPAPVPEGAPAPPPYPRFVIPPFNEGRLRALIGNYFSTDTARLLREFRLQHKDFLFDMRHPATLKEAIKVAEEFVKHVARARNMEIYAAPVPYWLYLHMFVRLSLDLTSVDKFVIDDGNLGYYDLAPVY